MFNQITIDIEKYIKEKWLSLPQFYESFLTEKDLFLKGLGFFKYSSTGQFNEDIGYHLIKLNDRLFGIGGFFLDKEEVTDNASMILKNIVEFDTSILDYTNNTYKDLEAALPIEAKIYIYSDEDKLLINKSGKGNIDLYCSCQVEKQKNKLLYKVYPSVFNEVKRLVISNLLEERIKNLRKK